jgi:hypothetical protein
MPRQIVSCILLSRDDPDEFDADPVSRRFGKRAIAGHYRRLKSLCEGNVHGIIRADIVSQFPRAIEEIEMAVAVEIDVVQIVNGFAGAGGRYLASPREASQSLKDLDVDEVWRMKFVPVSKEPGFDSGA